MNILYLSDIHFGRELLAHGRFTRREHIQSQLIQTVSELPENMHPHYIVVTGDIAWTGAAAEYEMAYAWFSELLSALGLDGEKITFCAGNHDINRKIAVQIPIAEIKDDNGFKLDKIDELYRYENINSYNVQIHAYNDFCHRLGVIPYEYRCEAESPVVDKFGFSKQWYSYTVGSKDIIFGSEKYRIVGFNTAMLSGYEEMPDDETFLGLPQVEQMISEHVIGKETGR
ncbi:MAG: metallophosphoesterase, partial [Eubacteriales bacterium]|nr:metallophosphoesterase [Eubacteriales bacterium]